jgi:hypothetical protein
MIFLTTISSIVPDINEALGRTPAPRLFKEFAEIVCVNRSEANQHPRIVHIVVSDETGLGIGLYARVPVEGVDVDN